MNDFTTQLLLAISGLSAVIAFLFKLLSAQWNERLKYGEILLGECKAENKKQAEQISHLTDLVARQQSVTSEIVRKA